MKSWRTSLFGTGGLVTILGVVLNALCDGDPATVVDWPMVIAGAMPCIASLFARDNKVSSEDVGVK